MSTPPHSSDPASRHAARDADDDQTSDEIPSEYFAADDGISNDDDDDHYISELLLWIYFSTVYRAVSAYENAAHLLEDIDRICDNIIARVDARRLFAAAPPFARPYVALLLEAGERFDGQQVWIRELVHRTPDDYQHRRRAKGTPRAIVRTVMADAIKELVGKTPSEGLYTRDDKVTRAIERGDHGFGVKRDWAHCNLFTVDKSASAPSGRPLQRIIGDAREANALLVNPAHMELFTLDSLMDRFAHCLAGCAKVVACLTVDLRHWFHQLPLPAHFRRYFRIPRAWPMGVHGAPGIAQACTWTIVLRELDRHPELRYRLQVDWVGEFDTYLRWLPLKNGGGIFVLIDNILVFHPSNGVVDLWQEHILRSANFFSATLKHPKDSIAAETPVVNTAEAFNRSTVTANAASASPRDITFAGIVFSADGTRPSKAPHDDTQLHQETTVERWVGTHRALASVVSQCMWSFRVRRISPLLNRRFTRLHGSVQPGPGKSWDTSVTLTVEQTRALQAAYADCRAGHVGRFVNRTFPSGDGAIALVATDASMSPGEGCGGTGVVYALANAPYVTFVINGRHRHEKIVLGELSVILAAILAIDEAHKRAGLARVAMFVIAIDSMGAKGMTERGFSRSNEANDILEKIFEALGDRWLFLVYVHTTKNPADEGSRGLDFQPTKWVALVPELQRLAKYSVAAAVCADVTRTDRRLLIFDERRRPRDANATSNEATV